MAATTANPDETTEITETGEEGQQAPGGRKKLIIIGAAAALLLAAAGGGYMMFAGKKAEDAQSAAAKKKMVFFDLPEITTNLAAQPGQERPVYLRLKVALELEDQKMIAEITPLLPRVMDNFQIFLRELRPSDLEGSAGLYRLKEELVRRINAAVYPARVEAVLFKDVLVQ
ncbi:MAG: flagellar basal body-associated protein FliL [Hyphomicrobiales bacterium]|uniref:flagellar basal body-associated protein FliL n=1 Tax=Rhabdaerophilum calidifontis TaxID=2604328 RepID=UPI00123B148B|nr:flagellar basal body-associated protein FliL [Rhabdaerophilum calidifontis]MCA1999375.1 flagellar basal body-associated protein FliL [Hyphomicrobiales bacterium]